MDPSAIDNLFGFLAFAGLLILGIVQLRQQRKAPEAPASTPSAEPPRQPLANGNGKYATRSDVDLVVKAALGEHAANCPRAGEILKEIRGLNERLDRVLEERR